VGKNKSAKGEEEINREISKSRLACPLNGALNAKNSVGMQEEDRNGGLAGLDGFSQG
jgi:hypothetical protein